MERKNSLIKNIFYIFFAICFFSTGLLLINRPEQTNVALAENVTDENVDGQVLPIYFLRQEYLDDGDGDNSNDSLNPDSLISYNTFSSFQNTDATNYLKFSLARGRTEGVPNSIYNYVYYPDQNDTTRFQFYNITSVSLSINGQAQDINQNDFILESGASFNNFSSVSPQAFEIYFNRTGSTEDTRNAISIMDGTNVREGLYTLSLRVQLFTCVAGRSDMNEDTDSFTVEKDYTVPITYNFYVADEEKYFSNNQPLVSNVNFDSTVSITNATSPDAYYLYSNYSSKKNNQASEANTNNAPYLEYDYHRFELSISKELPSSKEDGELLFDRDTNLPVLKGDEIVKFYAMENNICRVYFTDVGNYNVSLNAIDVRYFTAENNQATLERTPRKFSLTGINSRTKNIKVYTYGYQANYTNFDLPADSNGIQPTSELKEFDAKTGKYSNGADITSEYLNSNPNYSQELTSTFVPSNIFQYLNNNSTKAPVQTDQTPISFSQNATLHTYSEVYSTTRVSNAYTPESYTLNGQQVYSAKFSGMTDISSEAGTYVYILAYTFQNYYETASYQNPSKVFYQVFYFEIVKEQPKISVMSQDAKTLDFNKEVFSNTFINQKIKITDLTKRTTTSHGSPYRKDVTIRVYAQNFDGTYKTSFGGLNGIAFQNSANFNSETNELILTEDAHYTIKMFYTNEMNINNIKIDDNGGFYEQYFTIDTQKIENIRGRNVSKITGSSNYQIISEMTNFTTNQNMTIAWDEKDSGAQTFAYYRYFPLMNEQFYSNNESKVSTTIANFIHSRTNEYLPVNSILNLDTSTQEWLDVEGNTDIVPLYDNVSAEYVFSDAGLYMIDVYDKAGNHSVDIFMIDNSKPIFAIGTDVKYELSTSSKFLTEQSTLYWADFKSIYIASFNTISYNNYNPTTVTEELLADYDIYTAKNGETSVDIFKAMYEKLWQKRYMQNLICNGITVTPEADGVSRYIDNNSYTGYYITVPINEVSWFMDSTVSSRYQQNPLGASEKLIAVDTEKTISVLIRDMSETRYVDSTNVNNVDNYISYYSARQQLIISFDSSKFFIEYFNNDKNAYEPLDPNSTVVTGENSKGNFKTTYLRPTSMEKEFVVTFIPTVTEGGSTTQVDTITIQHFPYVEETVEATTLVNGEKQTVTYHFMKLSENPHTDTLYSYDDTKQPDIQENIRPINLVENITDAGKYIIKRTYRTTDNFSFNQNSDYLERTYEFYVDRNDVISSQIPVSDDNSSHIESLVGGEIFVGMYDNGTNASLVVTFPDSTNGNKNGLTLYNSGTNNPSNPNPNEFTSILTTNKLPVNIYVPQVKYTKYATIQETTDGYKFVAEANDEMNFFTKDMSSEEYSLFIQEYALYVEIYKDNFNPTSLVATSSTNALTYKTGEFYPTLNADIAKDGFLKLYKPDGSNLTELSDEGTYLVKIQQGRFGNETGASRLEQSLIFKFNIQKSNPDFDVRLNGTSLNYNIENDMQNYYTNQDTVDVIWDKGGDFMAEIDIDKITIETSNGDTFYGGDANTWSSAPVLSNNSYVAKLNFDKLGVYRNGGWVRITMQYENHNDRYYDICRKRINIDLSAPNENIKNLINKTTEGNYISGLNENALRTKLKANDEETNNLNITSYNISKKTGTFRYYSYAVTKDFLQTLKNTKDTFKIYARSFTENGVDTKYDTNNTMTEVTPADFLASKSRFTDINDISTFNPYTYYEIVEMDIAENLTIYTIYITDYNGVTIEEGSFDDTGINNLFTYTCPNPDIQNAYITKTYTIENYKTANANNMTHNIYSRPDFELTDINYFGDAWAQIKLSLTNANGYTTTTYYTMTPWDDGVLYSYSGNTTVTTSIEDLFNTIGKISSRYKSSLTIRNRENGAEEVFYFNVRNTELDFSWPNQQNEEYISFTNPTATDLNNTTYASTFVTNFNIIADGLPLFGEGGQTNNLGLASLWQENNSISVSQNGTNLIFRLNTNFPLDTKLIYEFTDNYGTKHSEIRLFRETPLENEYGPTEGLYSYYDNNLGRTYYVVEDGFQFRFNTRKYEYRTFNLTNINGESVVSNQLDYVKVAREDVGSIRTLTFNVDTEKLEQTGPDYKYNISCAIQLFDLNDLTTPRRTVYFTLYKQIPSRNFDDDSSLVSGQYKFLDANGNNITKAITTNQVDEETGYFSQVRVLYSLPDQTNALVPVVFSYSTDKVNWMELSNETRLECPPDEQMQKYYIKVWYNETYLRNDRGNPAYVFGTVPDSQIFEFNVSTQTTTYWVEKTINSQTSVVEKSNTIYETRDGMQYSNHYIVDMKYYRGQTEVQVKTNRENEVTAEIVEEFEDNNSVTSVLYRITNIVPGGNLGNIPAVNTYIVISFIPKTDNFVEEFFTSDVNGALNTRDNLISASEKQVVITTQQVEQMTLRWSKYNGISQNTNNIRILKDGIQLNPLTRPVSVGEGRNRKDYNEVILTRSGKYTISFLDNAGNVQKFNIGNAGQTEVFTLIFLKDVPFTITYTNPETQKEEVSDPINRAVYNGTVVLDIDRSTRNQFYASDGQPVISVERDGVDYSNHFEDNLSYTFTETGHYRVSFTATSALPEYGEIRVEWYEFTILNPEEHRYSYIFNEYDRYYVEKIVKDGVDVTDIFTQTLDAPKMIVNGKTYLSKLVLSYLDEKTGAGVYFITVNSNDRFYQGSTSPSSWTYKVTIQTGQAPIRISIGQGEETTSAIAVTFNQRNMYLEMGECTVRVVSFVNNNYGSVLYSQKITSENTGDGSYQISADGTYFIQVVVGDDKDPVFSYKVIKKAPMNAATIIAIVISAIVLIAVIFIIIKLRKRISVK